MKIIELLVSGEKLRIAEQTCVVFYELSAYEADVLFALPKVYVELKVCIIYVKFNIYILSLMFIIRLCKIIPSSITVAILLFYVINDLIRGF